MYATTFMVVLRCVWKQFTEKDSELSIGGTTVSAIDNDRSSQMTNPDLVVRVKYCEFLKKVVDGCQYSWVG
ncbi:hypothetical protein D3C85_1594500 [compost metagenome]